MTTEAIKSEQQWIPTTDTFAARLALVRHRMGWNIKEAARECGVGAATWRDWETAGAMPRNLVTIAMTIATRTGCDYLWLVHGPGRGGAATSQSYSTVRVVARVKPPVERPVERPPHLRNPARSVRQTRPLVGVGLRPHTPVAV
ncbi:MAG TPA: helix-turn-helix transcriptional regulator [Micromonosporaceae bacterium]